MDHLEVVSPDASPPREPDPDLVAKARAAHPDWRIVSIADERTGDAYAFRLPGPAEYAQFRSMISDDESKPLATKKLADLCTIEPEAYREFVIRQPGMVDTFANHLLVEVGLGVKTTLKKL